MELDGYLQLLRRWWRLIVIVAAIGAGSGYVVSQRKAPVYEAAMTLIVTASRPTPDPADGLIPDQRSSLVKTYKELLLKRPVLEAVIAELGLGVDVETLANRLQVTEVRDTQILVLRAQDADPQMAAMIANTTVRQFNQQAPALLSNPYAANRAGLSVSEEATPPREPRGVGPLRSAAIGLMVGVLLAVGAALAAEYFDRSVRTAHDITLLTELPTVAEVGQLGGKQPYDKLVTINAPRSLAAESYRMVRLHLESGADGKPIRTLVVTSARPCEGKSITAANLAVGLAQTGLRVVLIDANLRRPSLHELFRKPNTVGYTTAAQREEWGQAYTYTIESGVENLRLLLSGPPLDQAHNSPARLLVPQRVLQVVAGLEDHADVQIFDSPSTLDAIETALLARSCDAALLVVQPCRTPANLLLQACEALSRSRTYLLGVVLNRVRAPAPAAPGAYYVEQRAFPKPAAPDLALSVHTSADIVHDSAVPTNGVAEHDTASFKRTRSNHAS